MKLRQVLDDFVVSEMNYFKIFRERKKFKLYILEKKGVELLNLLDEVSRKNNIALREFGFAGIKDRYAVTTQYITISSNFDLKFLQGNNYFFRFLGYVEKKIVRGKLQGNKFKITVRDLDKEDLKVLQRNFEKVVNVGTINYFDSQRFGSVIDGEFIGKCVVKSDFERACYIFLTGKTDFDSKSVSEDKANILRGWSDLRRVRINTQNYKKVVDEFLKSGSWLNAYKEIPDFLKLMYVSAYQSFLWNECVKIGLMEVLGEQRILKVDYNIGELFFVKDFSVEDVENLFKSFKSISPKSEFSDFEKVIVEKVLKKEGVEISDFDILDLIGNYFESYNWPVVLRPKNLVSSIDYVDEINFSEGKRFKRVISFSLPKGSYATIVIKSLFEK